LTLRGDPSLGRSQASGKVTINALKNSEEGFLVTPIFRPEEAGEEPPISTMMQELLAKFASLFQPPFGLPPQRSSTMPSPLKREPRFPISDLIGILTIKNLGLRR